MTSLFRPPGSHTHLLKIHIRHNVGNGTIQATEQHGGRPEKKNKYLFHILLPFFNVTLKFLSELCKFIQCYIT